MSLQHYKKISCSPDQVLTKQIPIVLFLHNISTPTVTFEISPVSQKLFPVSRNSYHEDSMITSLLAHEYKWTTIINKDIVGWWHLSRP